MLEYPEKSLNKIGNKQLFLYERIEGISSTIIPIASIERGLQVNTKDETRTSFSRRCTVDTLGHFRVESPLSFLSSPV